MDPITPAPQPIDPDQPQSQFSPQPVAPPPGHASKKKMLLLVGGALLVIIIIVAIIMMVTGKKSDNQTQSNDTSLYYNRSGYDRKKLAAGIGDPLAIKLTGSNEAQKLASGTVIIPACAVLTQDDLSKAGIKLFANNFGFPFMQNYLDKSGEAPFAADPNHMPSPSETMGCVYGVDSGNTLSIGVNQPFTATDGAVDYDIASLKYTKQADANGFQVYSRINKVGDETDTEYILRKNGATIALTFPYTDETKLSSLTKTVMTNFDNLSTKPQGVTQVSYDTPTFTQSFAKSCDLVNNADLKQITGTDMSPLVRSFWTTSSGVADFSSVSDYKTKTNYLRNQCIRSTNDPAYKTLVGTKTHTIQVTATTYENTQAASNGLQFISVGEGNDSGKKSQGVGEEAYLYKTPKDHQMALAFRQGRVVVELVYDFAFQDMDSNTYAAKLSPIGTKIASELKSFN